MFGTFEQCFLKYISVRVLILLLSLEARGNIFFNLYFSPGIKLTFVIETITLTDSRTLQNLF